jgi:protein NrfD
MPEHRGAFAVVDPANAGRKPEAEGGKAERKWDGPTYYGRSQLKVAPFDKWWVGGYIFLAGVSGGSAVVAKVAELALGKTADGVGRKGRYLGMVAPILGAPLLILDLHTPTRFYNFWRIAKHTSPMSIGTWILTCFIGSAGAAVVAQAGADLLGFKWLGGLARLGSTPAAVAGAGLGTYTPALLAATSAPYWAADPKGLSVRFASSSVAAGSAALALGEKSPAMRRTLTAISSLALVTELVATVVHHKNVKEKGVGASLKSEWGEIEELAVMGLGVLLPLGLFAAARRLDERQRAQQVSDLGALAVLAGSAMLRIATIGIGQDSQRRPEVSLRFSQPENLPENQPENASGRRRG